MCECNKHKESIKKKKTYHYFEGYLKAEFAFWVVISAMCCVWVLFKFCVSANCSNVNALWASDGTAVTWAAANGETNK